MTRNLRTYNSSSVIVWQELPIWLTPVKSWTPTSYFSSSVAHRPHVSSESGHRKRVFSKHTTEWRFLKTRPACRLFEDRRNKMWCIIYYKHYARSVTDAIVFFKSYFHRFRVDGWKRFECATCGRVFLHKRRGKISVFERFKLNQNLSNKKTNSEKKIWATLHT